MPIGKLQLVFLGAPGAGKGTQAVLASKSFGLKHLSTGEMLRQEIKRDTALGRKVKKVVESGWLVGDELVASILKKNLKKALRGFILDGFPRNLKQARMLEKIFLELKIRNLKVIFFSLTKKELIKRLSGRLYCRKCGATFNKNAAKLKPRKKGECDKCKSRLVQRKDDSVPVIKKRIGVYEKQTKPLIRFYSKRKILSRINAGKNINENFRELKKVLGG